MLKRSVILTVLNSKVLPAQNVQLDFTLMKTTDARQLTHNVNILIQLINGVEIVIQDMFYHRIHAFLVPKIISAPRLNRIYVFVVSLGLILMTRLSVP